MNKIFLVLILFFSQYAVANSGLYLGGQAAIDYERIDFKDLSPSSVLSNIYDKYSSKANYGFLVGYELPIPVLSLAGEFGMDLKSSRLSFHNFNSTSLLGREVETSEMKYVDILPGLSFFLDRILINVILGMERSKLNLKENLVLSTNESSTHRKAKRVGAAISFYPTSSLGLRLSAVKSSYKKTVFDFSGELNSIEPKIIRLSLSLIWKL